MRIADDRRSTPDSGDPEHAPSRDLHTATDVRARAERRAARLPPTAANANTNRHALENACAELGGRFVFFFYVAPRVAGRLGGDRGGVQGAGPGDHVGGAARRILGTGKLLRDTFASVGLAVDFVDLTE